MSDFFMSNHQPQPRAGYDENGDVVIFGAGETPAAEPKPVHKHVPVQQPRTVRAQQPVKVVRQQTPKIDAKLAEWNVVTEDPVKTSKPHEAVAQQPVSKVVQANDAHFVKRISQATSSLIDGTLQESKAQLEATHAGAGHGLADAWHKLRRLPRHASGAWKAANAPRTAPWNKKRTKPRSRATLFAVDTIRFGGTFAGIFITLFVAINYQSFWQIARAQLALGDETHTEQALDAIVKNDAPSGAAPAAGNLFSHKSFSDGGDLISYLPRVGPYENRLIIPKIGKNVPIVLPSMDSLMKEDWKNFEEDVQVALHHGVVHYPGSARPGQAGNFFVTGHSSYYPWDDGLFKDVFARLNELDIGDTYSVYYGGDLHTYKVVEKKEVHPSDTSVLDQPTTKRLSTLMTCTPVGTTLRRLIIIAEEVDPVTGVRLSVGERTSTQDSKPTKLDALPI